MPEHKAPIDRDATKSAGNGAGRVRPAKGSETGEAAAAFRAAAEGPKPGLVGEFIDFLRHNKKWWLTPIIVILLLFGLLIVLAGTGAAPFIYTLF